MKKMTIKNFTLRTKYQGYLDILDYFERRNNIFDLLQEMSDEEIITKKELKEIILRLKKINKIN